MGICWIGLLSVPVECVCVGWGVDDVDLLNWDLEDCTYVFILVNWKITLTNRWWVRV